MSALLMLACVCMVWKYLLFIITNLNVSEEECEHLYGLKIGLQDLFISKTLKLVVG